MWIWQCNWSNAASSWKDLESCDARSRKGYDSYEEAMAAGERHCRKCRGKSRSIIVFKIRKPRKRSTKKK